MNRKILTILSDAKTLRKKSEPFPSVDEWGDDEKNCIKDLQDTHNVSQGLGLAAPQIGIFKRAVVINPRVIGVDGDDPVVMVNPTLETSGDLKTDVEACFSIPGGVMGKVERPQKCKVTYIDQAGASKFLEAEGYAAVCLQHEIDHLDGILYVDRMGPLSRKMLLKKVQKIERFRSKGERLAAEMFASDHAEISGSGPSRKKTTYSKKRKPKKRKPKIRKSKKR